MEDSQQSGFYRMPHVQGSVCVFIAEDDVWRCDLAPERYVLLLAVVGDCAGAHASLRMRKSTQLWENGLIGEWSPLSRWSFARIQATTRAHSLVWTWPRVSVLRQSEGERWG